MASKETHRAALEASCGALLGLHAAAGLASGTSCRDGLRLLRAEEGLVRIAVACFQSATSSTAASAAAAPAIGATSSSKKRTRKRGQKRKPEEKDKTEGAAAAVQDLDQCEREEHGDLEMVQASIGKGSGSSAPLARGPPIPRSGSIGCRP